MPAKRHIAFIPARKGSKGFPGKNRLFFDQAADFVQESGLFNEVIVSTDDEDVVTKAQKRKFKVHHRNEQLSGDKASIKQVLENVAKEMKLQPEDYVWLIYVCMPYRNRDDFRKAKILVEEQNIASLCSFIRAKSHPFSCWHFDAKKNVLKQYIGNDVYRRQDKPEAWEHYHYLSCTQVEALKSINHELLFSKTYPIFLDEKTTQKLIEVDTQEDFDLWRRQSKAAV